MAQANDSIVSLDALPLAWEALERESAHGTGSGRLERRLAPGSAANLFVCLELPERHLSLHLELTTRFLPSSPLPDQMRGVAIRVERVKPGAEGTVRVILTLVDNSRRELFSALARDVAQATVRERSEPAQVKAMLNRLEAWQRLLDRLKPEGLTPQEQRGLVGELLVLERLCLPPLGGAEAVRRWEGPVGGLQDFVLPHGALEVKCTARQPAESFHASHLAQLDDSGLERLALVVVVVEEGEAVVGSTLPDHIERLRVRLAEESPNAEAMFWERLQQMGYLPEQSELYLRKKYAFRELMMYHVNADFPRLLRTSVPQGILEAEYDVSLLACQAFRISPEHLVSQWIGAPHE